MPPTRSTDGRRKKRRSRPNGKRRRKHTGEQTRAYLFLVHLQRASAFFEAKSSQNAEESLGDWIRRRKPCVRPKRLFRALTEHPRYLDHAAVFFAMHQRDAVTERDFPVVERFIRANNDTYICDLEARVRALEEGKKKTRDSLLGALERWGERVVGDTLSEILDARVKALPPFSYLKDKKKPLPPPCRSS